MEQAYSFTDALARVFGAEWHRLSLEGQDAILRDVHENDVEDLAEYRDNIGRGNLSKYVRCLT